MKRQPQLQTTGRWMSSVTGPVSRVLASQGDAADNETLKQEFLGDGLLAEELLVDELFAETGSDLIGADVIGADDAAANDGRLRDSAYGRAGSDRSGYDPVDHDRRGNDRAVSERIPVHPSRAASSVAARFTGALEDLAVADLLQILQLAGKSAVITVTRNGAHSHLWCSDGELIDAESGRLRGEAAVHRILGFSEGWLVADLRPATSTRTIFGSMQQVLLEAARQRDEAGALRHKLGDTQRCYRIGKSLAPDELAVLGSAEVRLLRSCADAPSLSELLESSELGELATLVALDRWIEAGQLVSAGLRLVPRAQPRESAITARTPQSVRAPVARPRITPVLAQQKQSRTWVWAALGAVGFFASGYVMRGQATRDLAPAALALQARAVPAPPAPLQIAPSAPTAAPPPAPVCPVPAPLPPPATAAAPLPAPIAAAPAVAAAPPPVQVTLPETAPRRPGRGSTALRQEPRPKLREKASAASGKPRSTPTAEPRVQIIGSEEPVVRVLD